MHTYNYLLHIAKRNKIDIKHLLKNNNNNNTRKQPNSSSKQTNNSKHHHSSINTNNNNNNPFTMTGCFNNSTQHQQFKQNVSSSIPYQPGKNLINSSHCDDTTNKVGDDEYNSLLRFKNKQLNNNANEQQYNEAMMYGNNFSLGNGVSSDRSKEQQQHQPYQSGNEATTYNDPRLSYTMYRLGLDSLTHILEGNNITFNDLLFLTKEDLTDMNFHIYQKNRILNFIEEFQKKSKDYSEEEIENFFNMNPKYNSLIVNNSNIINLKE